MHDVSSIKRDCLFLNLIIVALRNRYILLVAVDLPGNCVGECPGRDKE